MKRFLVTALVLCGCAGGAWGAPPLSSSGEGPHGKGNADSRELLEEILMARLTRELALEDEQAVLLVRHMTEFRDQMMALRRERGEKMRALRQAVRESKDESRIQHLMEEVRAVNEKSMVARNDVLDFDGFELTTWQQARLLVFLNDFEADMRRLLRRVQEHRAKDAGRPGRGDGDGRAPGERNPEAPSDSTQDDREDAPISKAPAPAG